MGLQKSEIEPPAQASGVAAKHPAMNCKANWVPMLGARAEAMMCTRINARRETDNATNERNMEGCTKPGHKASFMRNHHVLLALISMPVNVVPNAVPKRFLVATVDARLI